ncbi:hypothetical protein SCP_1101860 [Sparassis crispa]|uniref:Uncharacterized protein n=1 Tax=Sparassis crispa TaxID=139825 RepID=A0A401GZE0_9APHY|nr:hypothetical protein SCP_1101860 [Sparassis crispa]GBE87509.1 hypothetical protein SCP_1101860 [Sparassis crispa]
MAAGSARPMAASSRERDRGGLLERAATWGQSSRDQLRGTWILLRAISERACARSAILRCSFSNYKARPGLSPGPFSLSLFPPPQYLPVNSPAIHYRYLIARPAALHPSLYVSLFSQKVLQQLPKSSPARYRFALLL